MDDKDEFIYDKFNDNFNIKHKADILLFEGYINFDLFLKSLKSVNLFKQSLSVALDRIDTNNLIVRKL